MWELLVPPILPDAGEPVVFAYETAANERARREAGYVKT
jgi:hypothetical protein